MRTAVNRAGLSYVLLTLLAVALAAGLWALGAAAQPAPVYQGDKLGMEVGESAREYGARAEASISRCEGEAWALVTFGSEQDPERAAELLAPARRVSAVVFRGAAARPVPEPTAGEGREHVFQREAGRLHAAAGFERARPVGAVVKSSCSDLRKIVSEGEVLAVEALPADARWGAFAVAPVTP